MRVRLIAGITPHLHEDLVETAAAAVASCRTQPSQVILHLLDEGQLRNGPAPARLRTAFAKALDRADRTAQTWIDPITLRPDDDETIAEELGDWGSRLLRRTGGEIVIVLLDEKHGSDRLRSALRDLATVYEVTVISDPNASKGGFEPGVASTSLARVQRASAATIGGRLARSPWIARPSVHCDHDHPSRSLQALSDPWSGGGSGLVSACAELLRSFSSKGALQASRLDELRLHWERERLWDVSYVNELVLHDESHSMSVDRNVAHLCRPLLEDKTSGITEDDVYLLALSAWLHDWGHASCGVNGRYPTDPVEVRNYHGPLTALRLLHHGDQHGLVTDADHEVIKKVRLICAHHQGWTSSDHQQPNLEKVKARQLATIGHGGVGLGLIGGEPVGPYDLEAKDVLSASADEITHLRLLLALFRVADASDIGRHRVPHALSRVNQHGDLVRAYLQPAFSLYGQQAEALLSGIESGYLALLAAARQDKPRFDDVGDLAPDIAQKYLNPALRHPQEASSNPELLVKFGADAWDFAVHVASQKAYFADHGAVGGVYPTFENHADGRALVLHVFRNEADHVNAAKTVKEDVMKEFGMKKPGPQGPVAADVDPLKQAIRESFGSLGVPVQEFNTPRVRICSHASAI